MTDRYDIAWRIYCWKEGYDDSESIESLENWINDDISQLTDNEIKERETLLEIADKVISMVRRPAEESEMQKFLNALRCSVNAKVYVSNQRIVIENKRKKEIYYSPDPFNYDSTEFMLFVAEVNRILAEKHIVLGMKQ